MRKRTVLDEMERIPEPELMDDPAQALAYARADFEQPHSQFIEQFRTKFPDWTGRGYALDLGCGPGDICRRFAQAFPEAVIHGVDAAAAMLHVGREDLRAAQLDRRIELIKGYLPGALLPLERYDAVISNSLLHHLHDPLALWQSVLRHAAPGAPVLVMDLRRPTDHQQALELVERHAAGESAILRKDFHNSLLAAYRVDEIEAQLGCVGVGWLQVQAIGDRHIIAWGRSPYS